MKILKAIGKGLLATIIISAILSIVILGMEYVKSHTTTLEFFISSFLVIISIFSYCFYTDSEELE